MKQLEKKIVIYVKRDQNDKPFAEIFYQNGEELLVPTNFDKATAYFANYIAKKTVTNEIKGLIYSYTDEDIVDRFDISPLTDDNYCIIGSEHGRKQLTELIKLISDAASLPEVLAPVILTDGYNSVLLNEEALNLPTSNNKYNIIENIITEDKPKALSKVA